VTGTGRAGRALWNLGAVLVAGYALLPALWLVALSLTPAGAAGGSTLDPAQWTWRNYRAALGAGVLTRALLNSAVVAVLATVLAVTLATLAAYAIARLDFPGKSAVLTLALVAALLPPVALVGPLLDLWRSLGLYDSYAGLVLPYLSFALPLALWTLSAFFREIPWEMERAALVDGATPVQAFRRVVVPLAAPGVFTAAILVFFVAWNELLLAAALTTTAGSATVPAALAAFAGAPRFTEPAGTVAAAAVLVTVPVVAAVLAFQRRIVAGLTALAVPGVGRAP